MCWVRQDWCRQPGDDDDKNSGNDDYGEHNDNEYEDDDDPDDDVSGQARMEQASRDRPSNSNGPWRRPVFLRSVRWLEHLPL